MSELTCKICFKTFKRAANRKNHEKTHDVNQLKMKCPHCAKYFSKPCNLKYHCISSHPEQDATVSVWAAKWEIPVRKISFKCKICQKLFSRYENLKVHMKTQHHGMSPKTVASKPTELPANVDSSEPKVIAPMAVKNVSGMNNFPTPLIQWNVHLCQHNRLFSAADSVWCSLRIISVRC